MKKLLIIAISVLLTSSLFAQNAQIFRIATFPFTGSVVTNIEEGEYLAGLFSSEFIPLGYTLVARTSGLGTSANERNYQTSGATAEIAEIGKQVAADYVMVGTFSNVFKQISLKVEVIGVESSQIVASETRTVAYIEEIEPTVAEIVKNLDAQIKGINLDSQIATQKAQVYAQTSSDTFQLKNDYKNAITKKWVGRWMWIGGTVVITAGILVKEFGAGTEYVPSRSNHIRDNGSFDSLGYELTQASYEASYEADQQLAATVGITTIVIGGVALVAGVITDIVFSVRENNLLKDLESQGIYLSVTPTFKPDLVSGSMDYGMKFGLKYNF